MRIDVGPRYAVPRFHWFRQLESSAIVAPTERLVPDPPAHVEGSASAVLPVFLI